MVNLKRFACEWFTNSEFLSKSDEFFETLGAYNWPGDVRELINAVHHALAMEPTCPTHYPKPLPEHIRMHTIGDKQNDLGVIC